MTDDALKTAVIGDSEEAATWPRGGSTQAAEEHVAGRLLERFLIVRKAGEGGLGKVFVAYDPELDRKVALKLLKARGGPEAATVGRQMLQREAQAMAKLAHPNVVTVYDVGVVGEEVFVAMEYVEGETLREWLRSAVRSREAIVDVMLQAGRGLAAAHAAGIVHRDFKPDNVIVGADGRARVLDFGLAQAARRGVGDAAPGVTSATISASGFRGFSGTPAYMAPEQFTSSQGDPRSDIFSYAVTLWEALVGVRPFAAASVSDLRRAVTLGAIEAPPAERRLPRRLERILRRALDVEPERRYATMAALMAELERDPWAPLRRAARVLGVVLVVAALANMIYAATRPGHLEVAVEGPRGPLRPSLARVGDVALSLGPHGAAGEVAPGLYRLRIEAPGMVAAEEIVEVERGASQRIELRLAPTRGYVDVEASPAGASILVDGVDYGSRLRNMLLETGRHELRARLHGHYEARATIDVVADEEVRGYLSLAPALLWSRRQTGTSYPSQWIGDVTGDGLPEIAHRLFHVITVSDPWGERDLGSVELSPSRGNRHAWIDADGDGISELLAVEAVAGGVEVALWSLDPEAGLRRRWRTHAAGAPTRHETGLVAYAAAGGRVDTVAVTGFPLGATAALDLADGRRRWTIASEAVDQVVARRADGGQTIVEVGALMLRGIDAASGGVLWDNDARPPSERLALTDERLRGPLAAVDLTGDHCEDALVTIVGGAEGAGERAVAAVDGCSGRLLWRRQALRWALREPSLDVEGGFDDAMIAVVEARQATGDTIAALDRSGARRWSADSPADSAVSWWPGERGGAPMVEVLHASGVDFRGVEDGAVVAEIATETAPRGAPAHADWDGDGRLDLVLSCDGRRVVGVRPEAAWTGAIAFASEVSEVTAIGDVNRDGFADLMVQSFGPKVLSGRRSLWRRTATDAIRATPAVADFDGDGALEIAAFGGFSTQRALHLVDAATGVIEARSTIDSSQVLRAPALVPAADGGVDLLVLNNRALRRFSGRDASLIAEVEVCMSYSAPVVVDLDGDGEDEVVITPWDEGEPIEVVRLADLGAAWSIELGDGAWGAPTLVDLDDAPGSPPELVFGLHGGGVVALRGRGEELWRVDLGTRQVYAPNAVDVDGDGELELLASAAGDRGELDLVLLSRQGAELRRWSGDGAPLGGGAVVEVTDADGEASRLLVVATAGRGLVAFDGGGAPRWRLEVGGGGDPPRASAPLVIDDLDGDGAPEVLAAFFDGVVYVVDAATGELRWRYASGEGNIEATPVAADLDGDGVAEVIVAGHDRELVVLRAPVRAP